MYKSILLSLFLILFISSCDSDSQNRDSCSPDEFSEEIANTDCLAEVLLLGCSNLGCRAIDPQFPFFSVDLDSCLIINCQTLECDISVNLDPSQPGLLTELSGAGSNIRGIFEAGELEGENLGNVRCQFFQP